MAEVELGHFESMTAGGKMLIWEIVTTVIGAFSGVMAAAFVVVAFRGLNSGRSAYEANKLVARKSIWANISGDLKDGSIFDENRTNHGLAIDLKSGRLVSQQRLSSQAVDEVIAR